MEMKESTKVLMQVAIMGIVPSQNFNDLLTRKDSALEELDITGGKVTEYLMADPYNGVPADIAGAFRTINITLEDLGKQLHEEFHVMTGQPHTDNEETVSAPGFVL